MAFEFGDLLDEYAKECHEIAVSKGWYDKTRIEPELLCLIHSEVSEALEAVRKPGPSEKIPGYSKLEEELADTVIRIMDMSAFLGLHLGRAIQVKMEYNRSRSYRHGGKAY